MKQLTPIPWHHVLICDIDLQMLVRALCKGGKRSWRVLSWRWLCFGALRPCIGAVGCCAFEFVTWLCWWWLKIGWLGVCTFDLWDELNLSGARLKRLTLNNRKRWMYDSGNRFTDLTWADSGDVMVMEEQSGVWTQCQNCFWKFVGVGLSPARGRRN